MVIWVVAQPLSKKREQHSRDERVGLARHRFIKRLVDRALIWKPLSRSDSAV